ncbi:MFS transporter [Micromonospora sp. HM5-17]|uniref:MFS transporter n=1 Tax=Micromonospora sp. HM5-17 TaxID=2487710 RepID=UPI0018F53813|nr:MFS transporter [Micromonospora sp. HM5-17]
MTRWEPRLWALLLVLSGNMALDSVEVSVVLVALPTIGADLGLSPWGAQWLMSGFAVGFGVLLLAGGRITARWGTRRLYLAAMAGFALASLVGGLSDDIAVLVATRVVKGCCAALTAPAGLAIIVSTFPGGTPQRRAVSVYAWVGAVGFTLGLLLSAGLVEVDWHGVFLFPAPVALLLLVSGLRLLPPDPPRSAAPRLRGLPRGALVRSALGAATLNGTYQSLLVLFTFQAGGIGWRPWQTVLALLPACVPLVLTVPFAAAMVARFGTARLIAVGAFAAFLGQAYYLWRPAAEPYPTTALPALLLVEAGFVFAFAALNMQATAEIPVPRRGVAVALYQTAVQFGAALLLPLVILAAAAGGHRAALALTTSAAAVGLVTALIGLTRGPAADRAGQRPRAEAAEGQRIPTHRAVEE